MIIPDLFIIEPTRCCNYSCFMCPNRFYLEAEKGHMDMKTYSRIIEEIKPYAKLIQLYWMGEPLMNPYIFQFIKIAKKETKAKVVLSTNGSLLSPDISEKLLSTKLDKLIIDVDADNDYTYKKIRSQDNYKQLVENIEYLLSFNKSTEIILQFLDFKINHNEIINCLKRWKEKKCTIRISWIDTWANQMPELKNLAFSVSPYVSQERQPCADLWHRAVINYRGELNLCCHDYKPLYNLGNVSQQSLIGLWNSDLLNSFRSSHLNSRYPGLCKECIEWAKLDEYKELLE